MKTHINLCMVSKQTTCYIYTFDNISILPSHCFEAVLSTNPSLHFPGSQFPAPFDSQLEQWSPHAEVEQMKRDLFIRPVQLFKD